MNSLSQKDMMFIVSFGDFVQEKILVPVPLIITSPFLINSINEHCASEFLEALEKESINFDSYDISIDRIKYLIKYTVDLELFKRKCRSEERRVGKECRYRWS